MALVLLVGSGAAQAERFAHRQLQLVATDYKMTYQLNLADENLSASAQLTITNCSDHPADHIPLTLYRLLHINAVTDAQHQPLTFTQQVLSDEAFPQRQVNYTEVQLPQPLAPAQSFTINLRFEGMILGYVETGLAYVKDSINQDFSIIRQDAYAYPQVLYPNDDVNRHAKWWLHTFNYDVSVEVPEGYVVANAGRLVAKNTTTSHISYRYQNTQPAWRMDFTIAKYQRYQQQGLTLFSLEDQALSTLFLNRSSTALSLYSQWFGPLQTPTEYSVLELPEGYGSQADRTGILIVKEGFTDRSQMYHELSHLWNVKFQESHSPRWNEGLATFLQYLVADKLDEPGMLARETNDIFNGLKQTLTQQNLNTLPPLLDNNNGGLGIYSIGMPLYHLLYDIEGADSFNRILSGFYQQYYATGATTEQFVTYAKAHSRNDLTAFFDDWAYSNRYASLISQSHSYADLLAHYTITVVAKNH
ncbi:hypothetical protein [Shewanella sp.]|uniref:hypothetical protein n=1 Tax=Shewanella sp. TaxID=50422 RepID=UPI003A96D747